MMTRLVPMNLRSATVAEWTVTWFTSHGFEGGHAS